MLALPRVYYKTYKRRIDGCEYTLNSELHVFIIWKKARDMTEDILSDLKKKFELLQVYEVNWSSEFFLKVTEYVFCHITSLFPDNKDV
jgi:hypothetical protein